MHDPDVPRKGGFTHWLVWNIAPTTTNIKEESNPPGSMEGTNDAGNVGYMGPCPPSGTHAYTVTLYALDIVLDIGEESRMFDLKKAMEGHVIAQGVLTGLYTKE